MTASGNQCRRKATEGEFCHSHAPQDASQPKPFRPVEMDDDGTMTQAAFSRLLHVADGTIHQYCQRGVISKNEDNRIEVAAALEALEASDTASGSQITRRRFMPVGGGKIVEIISEAEADGDDDDGKEAKGDLKTQKLKAQVDGLVHKARLEKMKADKEAGKLVEIEIVDRERFAAYRVARGQLLNIPNRVASELAGMHRPADVHARLTEEIRDVLTELARTLESMDFTGGDDG